MKNENRIDDRLAIYTPSQYSRERVSFKVIILSKVWHFINVTLFRYSPSFARGWRRFLVRSFGGVVSTKSSFSNMAVIDFPWNVEIGEYSSLGEGAWIYALDRIRIGDKVCIGKSAQLLTGTHDITSAHFDLLCRPIRIGSGAWIANSAAVLPGVTVGEGAVVGACAVVTKDVEPWTVVAGNPAKFIKKRVLREK